MPGTAVGAATVSLRAYAGDFGGRFPFHTAPPNTVHTNRPAPWAVPLCVAAYTGIIETPPRQHAAEQTQTGTVEQQ